VWHRPHVRLWVIVVAAAVAATALTFGPSADAHRGGAFWSMAKVMRQTDGARLRVGTRIVRLDADTMLCSGDGRSLRRGGVRRWTHFMCTYTTFTRSGVGPDVEFRVHALGTTRFVVTHARWVRGTS
jgi:hypothetical protein